MNEDTFEKIGNPISDIPPKPLNSALEVHNITITFDIQLGA